MSRKKRKNRTDYDLIEEELKNHHAPNEYVHGSMFCGPWYEPWRAARMIKLCRIMGGKGWFRGKRILELGCGHGHVGAMLDRWGAEVLLTDGRPWCVEATNYFWPHLEVRLVDQTQGYDLGRFDMVIHWGITYHLPPDKWEGDLECAVRHSDRMCYESEVVDSSSDRFVEGVEDCGLDKSLTDVGIRISAATIERKFRELGCSYRRYDDEDLDSYSGKYSWKEQNSGKWFAGQRRFWMVHPK